MPDLRRDVVGSALGSARFVLATVALIWLTHALAFFAHEYSHSFVAWALGWKRQPWLLNFVVIGNGALFILGQALFRSSVCLHKRAGALLLYWLCVMCVGNFLAYVPIRTFTTMYDMGTLRQALDLSPWSVLLGLGVPFALGGWFLFGRLLPELIRVVLATPFERAVVVLLTSFVVFFFFGGAALYGPFDVTCKALSAVSMAFIFPISAAAMLVRLGSHPSAKPRTPQGLNP